MRKPKPKEKALMRSQGYKPWEFLVIKTGADYISLWNRQKQINWEVRI